MGSSRSWIPPSTTSRYFSPYFKPPMGSTVSEVTRLVAVTLSKVTTSPAAFTPTPDSFRVASLPFESNSLMLPGTFVTGSENVISGKTVIGTPPEPLLGTKLRTAGGPGSGSVSFHREHAEGALLGDGRTDRRQSGRFHGVVAGLGRREPAILRARILEQVVHRKHRRRSGFLHDVLGLAVDRRTHHPGHAALVIRGGESDQDRRSGDDGGDLLPLAARFLHDVDPELRGRSLGRQQRQGDVGGSDVVEIASRHQRSQARIRDDLGIAPLDGESGRLVDLTLGTVFLTSTILIP